MEVMGTQEDDMGKCEQDFEDGGCSCDFGL